MMTTFSSMLSQITYGQRSPGRLCQYARFVCGYDRRCLTGVVQYLAKRSCFVGLDDGGDHRTVLTVSGGHAGGPSDAIQNAQA